jgi:hypothetical protein
MAMSKCTAWNPEWSNGSDSENKLVKYCHKYVNVFGITLCVTQNSWKASEAKAVHVANVIAQYMDNDEDGQADDPSLPAQMARKNSVLIYHNEESDMIWDTDLPWIIAGAMSSCQPDELGL